MEKMNLELKKKIYQEYFDGVSIQGLAKKYVLKISKHTFKKLENSRKVRKSKNYSLI